MILLLCSAVFPSSHLTNVVYFPLKLAAHFFCLHFRYYQKASITVFFLHNTFLTLTYNPAKYTVDKTTSFCKNVDDKPLRGSQYESNCCKTVFLTLKFLCSLFYLQLYFVWLDDIFTGQEWCCQRDAAACSLSLSGLKSHLLRFELQIVTLIPLLHVK